MTNALQTNILITLEGVPQIVDIGLNKIVDENARRGGGITRWAAPELFQGGARSFASDIYALSMVFVEVS